MYILIVAADPTIRPMLTSQTVRERYQIRQVLTERELQEELGNVNLRRPDRLVLGSLGAAHPLEHLVEDLRRQHPYLKVVIHIPGESIYALSERLKE